MTKMGHNSKTTFAQGQLRSIVERIERLEEEKKTIGADIKEVYAEAKGNGFDTKTIRKVIALRKKEAAEREEEQSMLDLYLTALGMQADLFDDDSVDITPAGKGYADGQSGAAPAQPDDADYMGAWEQGNKARLEAAQ
jgi:uncharacterized protein (UPF0335 family)